MNSPKNYQPYVSTFKFFENFILFHFIYIYIYIYIIIQIFHAKLWHNLSEIPFPVFYTLLRFNKVKLAHCDLSTSSHRSEKTTDYILMEVCTCCAYAQFSSEKFYIQASNFLIQYFFLKFFFRSKIRQG